MRSLPLKTLCAALLGASSAASSASGAAASATGEVAAAAVAALHGVSEGAGYHKHTGAPLLLLLRVVVVMEVEATLLCRVFEEVLGQLTVWVVEGATVPSKHKVATVYLDKVVWPLHDDDSYVVSTDPPQVNASTSTSTT